MSSGDEQLHDDCDYPYGSKSSPTLTLGTRKSKRKQVFHAQGAAEHHQPSEPTRQNRRKVRGSFESICPVCQLTLRSGDVENHLKHELEKLSKSRRTFKSSKVNVPRGVNSFPSANSNSIGPESSSQSSEFGQETAEVSELDSVDKLKNQRARTFSTDSNASSDHHVQPCTSSSGIFSESGPSTSYLSNAASAFSKKNQFKEPGQECYRRVKVNRFLRIQTRRWQLKDLKDEVICPVCGEPVPAEIPEDLQRHVDKCLRKQEGEESSEEELDVEGDEYEWCGMRKVRLTSLLKSQGQLDALGTLVEKGNEDANVEVCLVQEDEDQFGPAQYSQDDLAGHSSSDDDVEVEVDNPQSSDPPFPNFPDHSYVHSPSDAVHSPANFEDPQDNGHGNASAFGGTSRSTVVEALEIKIRDLEAKGIFICHICHGPYDVPLTSTVCWHVHCEKCWLQALATQKLCPQCKVIVSPTELRRVYL